MTVSVKLIDYVSGMSRDSAIIVNETVELARALSSLGRRVVLISKEHACVSGLTVVSDWEELDRKWQQIGAPEARFIGFDKATEDPAAELCGKSQLNFVVSHKRNRIWVEHAIANIAYLERPSLMRCAGVCKNVPAFIVGSGPSLERNASLLVKAKEVGLLFSMGASSRVMPVTPDVIVNIESEDTRVLYGDLGNAILCGSIGCRPEVLDEWAATGRLSPIYPSNPSGAVEAITGCPRLETSISASTTAINLARLLGCDPIILVGQDLAHTNGYCYSPGAGGGRAWPDGRYEWGSLQREVGRYETILPDMFDVVTVPAWGGGSVQCTRDHVLIHRYLASWAKGHPETRCIDATEGGAAKAGWDQVTLENALAGLLGAARPTLAELRARMEEAGSMATQGQIYMFLAAQHRLAGATANRCARVGSLVNDLLEEPAATLPAGVIELVEWAVASSEWTWAYSADAVYGALERYRHESPKDDEIEERRAALGAVQAACEQAHKTSRELAARLKSQLERLGQ